MINQTVVVLFPEKVLDEVLVLKPAEKRSSTIHEEYVRFISAYFTLEGWAMGI